MKHSRVHACRKSRQPRGSISELLLKDGCLSFTSTVDYNNNKLFKSWEGADFQTGSFLFRLWPLAVHIRFVRPLPSSDLGKKKRFTMQFHNSSYNGHTFTRYRSNDKNSDPKVYSVSTE